MHTHAICLTKYISPHRLHHRVQPLIRHISSSTYKMILPWALLEDQVVFGFWMWVSETLNGWVLLPSTDGSTDWQMNRLAAHYNLLSRASTIKCARYNVALQGKCPIQPRMHSPSACASSYEHLTPLALWAHDHTWTNTTKSYAPSHTISNHITSLLQYGLSFNLNANLLHFSVSYTQCALTCGTKYNKSSMMLSLLEHACLPWCYIVMRQKLQIAEWLTKLDNMTTYYNISAYHLIPSAYSYARNHHVCIISSGLVTVDLNVRHAHI